MVSCRKPSGIPLTCRLGLLDRHSHACASHEHMHACYAQSCPTLCSPMGCSLPGSSVHGILQARIMEWVAGAALVAQMVNNLPAIQETQVHSLGREDPLEKETATISSILSWRIPWTKELGGLQSMGLQRGGHNWAMNTWAQQIKNSNSLMAKFLLNVVLHKNSCNMGYNIFFLGTPGLTLCQWEVKRLASNGFQESTCQCRGHKRQRFNPWVRKNPWRRKGNRCNILAWKIPWKEGPSGLKPMGWQRVRQDWAHTRTYMQWTNSTAAGAALCRPHQSTSSPGWYIPTAKHNIQSMVFAQQMWTAF